LSLKPLIKNQRIRIDDHKRGNREIKDWDDPSIDIHIDKSTKIKIEGRFQYIDIKVPINTDREIEIKSNWGKIDIPKSLEKEIHNAFSIQKTRDDFITDLVKVLKNFSSFYSDQERALMALKMISKHFDLNWSDAIQKNYYEDALRGRYIKEILDEDGRIYRLLLDGRKILIEDTMNIKSTSMD